MQTIARYRRWVVAALVAASILWWLSRPVVIVVDVATAAIGTVEVTIEEDGQTRVRDRYVVSAPVAGTIAAITLEEGDRVRQGEPVTLLSPLPLDPRLREQAEARMRAVQAEKRAADAAVAEARARAEQARREMERLVALAAGGHVAEQELDRVRTEEASIARMVEVAEFKSEAAACEIESARAALIQTDPERSDNDAVIAICAPGEGSILRVYGDSARAVSVGEPLVEVGDPAHLEIVVDLLSEDAVRVVPGDEVRVSGWGGDVTLAAVVRRVEPGGYTKVSPLGIEEQRVDVVADFIDVDARLGDGYRVETTIVLERREGVMRVPVAALFRHDGGHAVFALVDGRARLRPVAVGLSGRDFAEVVEGLAAGDAVVVHPDERIADGVRIAAR